MQMLSLVWGILAIIGMFVAFFPCLGSLNWLNIPFAAVGVVIGIIAVNQNRGARGAGMAGLIMCAVAVVLGGVRLLLGGGIL
jgi:hypothetical protein